MICNVGDCWVKPLLDCTPSISVFVLFRVVCRYAGRHAGSLRHKLPVGVARIPSCSETDDKTGERRAHHWLQLHSLPGRSLSIDSRCSIGSSKERYECSLHSEILDPYCSKGYPLMSVYSATKFAVRGLTQAAGKLRLHLNIILNLMNPKAQEWGPHKITVNGESAQVWIIAFLRYSSISILSWYDFDASPYAQLLNFDLWCMLRKFYSRGAWRILSPCRWAHRPRSR
jgi:hypothetical protein